MTSRLIISLAAIALGVPIAASAADFNFVPSPPIDAMGSYYRSQRESQQIEMDKLSMQMQRDEMQHRREEWERQRAQGPLYCRLPDGRFVQCQ